MVHSMSDQRLFCDDRKHEIKGVYSGKTQLSAMLLRYQVMTLMGHPELSSFSPAYTVYAGMGGGQALPCTLFKNVVYGALRFWEEVARFTFQSTVLVKGGSHKNSRPYSVYAVDNVDNSGRPLTMFASTYLQDQLV